MRESAILETKPRAALALTAGPRGTVATSQADDHLLLLGKIAAGDLGRRSIADSELNRDGRWLARRVEHPHPSSPGASRAAFATSRTLADTLAPARAQASSRAGSSALPL